MCVLHKNCLSRGFCFVLFFKFWILIKQIVNYHSAICPSFIIPASEQEFENRTTWGQLGTFLMYNHCWFFFYIQCSSVSYRSCSAAGPAFSSIHFMTQCTLTPTRDVLAPWAIFSSLSKCFAHTVPNCTTHSHTLQAAFATDGLCSSFWNEALSTLVCLQAAHTSRKSNSSTAEAATVTCLDRGRAHLFSRLF